MMMRNIYTPQQRAERIVNRWMDYLGCGASEEHSSLEWDQLRALITAEIEGALALDRLEY